MFCYIKLSNPSLLTFLWRNKVRICAQKLDETYGYLVSTDGLKWAEPFPVKLKNSKTCTTVKFKFTILSLSINGFKRCFKWRLNENYITHIGNMYEHMRNKVSNKYRASTGKVTNKFRNGPKTVPKQFHTSPRTVSKQFVYMLLTIFTCFQTYLKGHCKAFTRI